ncbi:hypothetical protein [Methylomonas fluvii]|uniref:Helix-turn-helix domain-containing protein n=1 Tax=Methylomonas fluvii TaxID=1854564 RepID=A0ABR9DGE3_9GAMM|nr:hypothetical protein [Methylomonas fluvii]MBD9361329.1 hypothetical protein [Methylomonas fluvii]CAD6874258.1 hypothetical protein [Methylomonas fluvii]
MNNNKLALDREEFAAAISVSLRTLDQMIKDGKVPPHSSKIPKHVWPIAVIDKWLLEEYNMTVNAVEPEKKRGRKRLAL